MPTERTIDLLANSFDLNVRRKFTLNNKDGQKIIDLYFKPITRSDRKVVNKDGNIRMEHINHRRNRGTRKLDL